MTETDPFVRIKEYVAKTQESAKKVVERLLTRKDSEKAKRDAFLNELKACAEEASSLMGDVRYSRQVKWLAELRQSYSKALERTSPALISEIARIQGKIENLDALLNRPKQAVKEYESMQKELNK